MDFIQWSNQTSCSAGSKSGQQTQHYADIFCCKLWIIALCEDKNSRYRFDKSGLLPFLFYVLAGGDSYLTHVKCGKSANGQKTAKGERSRHRNRGYERRSVYSKYNRRSQACRGMLFLLLDSQMFKPYVWPFLVCILNMWLKEKCSKCFFSLFCCHRRCSALIGRGSVKRTTGITFES